MKYLKQSLIVVFTACLMFAMTALPAKAIPSNRCSFPTQQTVGGGLSIALTTVYDLFITTDNQFCDWKVQLTPGGDIYADDLGNSDTELYIDFRGVPTTGVLVDNTDCSQPLDIQYCTTPSRAAQTINETTKLECKVVE